MKLHLGCGNDYKPGYLNCDCTEKVKVDKIIDLEEPLYMFEDNSIEEVICYHVLEHINNFIPLMHEIHRICKKDALIRIKTPFYSAWGQFNDPTHVRVFSPWTFTYFKKGNYSHEVNCNKDMFKEEKVKINFGVGKASKLNFLFNPIINFNKKVYCRFFAFILPCSEMQYVLRVLK